MEDWQNNYISSQEIEIAKKKIAEKIGKVKNNAAISLAGKISTSTQSMRNLQPIIGYFFKKKKPLIILDDVYPQPLSSFRVVEYNYYLEKIRDSIVYSTGYGFRWLKETRSFEEVLMEHVKRYPRLKGKIIKFDESKPLKAKLAYFVFLGNADTFLDTLEKNQIPFIFTLYPGGSFALNQQWSDGMLKRVFSSPFFRKVIVTQKISYDYLISNNFCDQEYIEFIYGGVFPSDIYHSINVQKRYFKQDKETLDICFVAHKYTERGVDKGYDVFIDVAKILCTNYENINFHVVGPFDESDIDVTQIIEKITFHGLIRSDMFPAFYSSQDIILSPNIPFAMIPGGFDGFPTGACIEAGLNGVVPFITDPLKQNIKFNDRDDIVLVPHDAAQIANIIEQYYHDEAGLYALSMRSKETLHNIFGIEAQMKRRIELIQEYI